MSPRTLFRSFAVAEVVTWSLLIVGMILKYAVGVGDWRRTATDDPRDRRPLDRLLRWMLGHLVLALVLLVVAVVVVFAVLLAAGPPVQVG